MKPQNKTYRFLEMVPGFVIWGIFVFCLVLSKFFPLGGVYFIIIFDIWWIVRISYKLIFLFFSWRKMEKTKKINWLDKCQKIAGWEKIYHVVFLPTYKEGKEIIFGTLTAISNNAFPANRIIVVLAGEDRDKENFLSIAKEAEEEFKGIFFKFIYTVHPKGLPNEISGKASNASYAGEIAKKIIDEELKIPYENIISSCFDVDSVIHPQYFSRLAYLFLTVPNPARCSFQPIAIFNNNIWESPFLMRVVARGTTFWLLTEMARKELLFTFSSHSMSFKALVDVGFWDRDVVSDDSRIFLQCYNRYNGNYRVIPMYLPISMDTVYAGDLKKSLVEQYKQMLRWGYGVENVPYMLWYFIRNKKMPWIKKIGPLWTQFEGSCSWATAPIIITFMGYLPFIFARSQEKSEAIIQNAPFILENLMNITIVGLLFTAVLSILLLPPKPSKYKFSKYFSMLLQWLFLPVTMIIYGSIPATDAITRLMLGRYLGFRVTEKKRVKTN